MAEINGVLGPIESEELGFTLMHEHILIANWSMRAAFDDWVNLDEVIEFASAEAIPLSDELAELAFRSADAVGASLAGVDVLCDANGRRFVLEVNAVPGWKTLAKTVKTDIAAVVLEHVRQVVESSQ